MGAAQGTSADHAAAHRIKFCVREWPLNMPAPLARSIDRPWGKQRFLVDSAVIVTPQTRPLPLVGFLDKTRPHGVALDVASCLVEILIVFNGKRFVPSLIEMAVADAPPVTLPARDVRDRQPLHEGRELAIFLGPQ